MVAIFSVLNFLGNLLITKFMFHRAKELWEEGVLVSEKQLDPDEVD